MDAYVLVRWLEDDSLHIYPWHDMTRLHAYVALASGSYEACLAAQRLLVA
jgi:hypothetical protein